MKVVILTRPGDGRQHYFNVDDIVHWTETMPDDRGSTQLATVVGVQFVAETPAQVFKKIREAD